MLPHPAPDVVYCAPSSEVLKAFARQVCHRLGTPYQTLEVQMGFSAFIEVVARIEAQVLTAGGQVVDNAATSH